MLVLVDMAGQCATVVLHTRQTTTEWLQSTEQLDAVHGPGNHLLLQLK